MPKSRRDSLANTSINISYDDAEMADRIESRLEGLVVDVMLPSRSRGGIENLRVRFGVDDAQVESGSGNTYHVDIPFGTCDCPDHVNRQGRCRHIEAVSIAQGLAGQGISQGSDTAIGVVGNQAIAGITENELQSERELQRAEYYDDGFFYGDNPEQFREDSERVLREPLPYYYENVLNGSDITFGIELEFVRGNSDAIARELYDMGICGNASMSGYHGLRTAGKWTLERDGSVTVGGRGGELISPILTDTPETWRTLQTVCEVAKRHGAGVNFKTGGHIHIGAEKNLDGKKQRWRRFFKMTAGFEDVFHKLAGGEQGVYRGVNSDHYTQSSRGQSHHGITADLPDVEDTELYRNAVGRIGEDKYRSINLLPFREKKTVEFRAFNGSLTPEIIQANVKYAAGLVNAAERSRTRSNESFNVTDHDKRRGGIINRYLQIENDLSDNAIMNTLDTVCSRKEDKEQILGVLVRNRWGRRQGHGNVSI